MTKEKTKKAEVKRPATKKAEVKKAEVKRPATKKAEVKKAEVPGINKNTNANKISDFENAILEAANQVLPIYREC